METCLWDLISGLKVTGHGEGLPHRFYNGEIERAQLWEKKNRGIHKGARCLLSKEIFRSGLNSDSATSISYDLGE